MFWLNKGDASDSLKTYWNWVEDLQDYLSIYFRIYLEHTELYFAVYRIGLYYAPHVD